MSQLVARSRKPPQRKKLSRGCAVWLVILAILILLTPLTLYERENNIPNPFWGMFNGTYTYTPNQGPADPSLLDSCPEDALLSVLHDYISVAGTYPCAADLAHWQESDLIDDLVFVAKGCTVVRPVTSMSIAAVYVFHGFIEHGPQADVTYQVTYADGETLADTTTLVAAKAQEYFLAYTHLDCWFTLAATHLYPDVVQQVPPHVALGPGPVTPCS